jgi:hypothetical protein
MLGERFRLTGKAMIHSSRRERKTKAIAEVLAMIADAHPELVRGRPRPRKTDEWLRESATEFCAALDRHAEHAMENRRPPGRASLPARPRRHTPKSPLLAAEREKVVVALRPLPHAALAARLAQGCAPKLHVLSLTMQAGDAARGKRAWAGWPQDRTMDKPKQERRNEARRRALKGARIVFGRHNALIDCTVSNLSDRGARLKVESPIGIPDTFDLMLDNAPVRGCRVTWRKATQIGVAFA